MPLNARRSDGPSWRPVAAVGAPVALVAIAGALTLATPANAASSGNPLPFPTAVCGTATPKTGSAGPSTSATTSRSATATPQPSASPSGTTSAPAKAGAAVPGGKSDPPPPPASASASKTTTAGNSAPGTPAPPPPATPTPSPSASKSSSSSGGFWGWLNGVWTWIFGSVQLPPAAAAPAMNAAYIRTVSGTHNQPQTTPRTAATPTASCVPKSAIKANTATSDGNTAAEIPWHLSSPSMTMTGLTYNGVTTIQTKTGAEQVLDFTAAKVTLLSMVTYSQQGGGKLQYVNGGQNQTVTLTNAHLLTTTITSDVLGLIHQTFTPQNPGLLVPLQGLTIPIPVLFTNVEADNAFLSTQSIVIPGFNGHGN